MKLLLSMRRFFSISIITISDLHVLAWTPGQILYLYIHLFSHNSKVQNWDASLYGTKLSKSLIVHFSSSFIAKMRTKLLLIAPCKLLRHCWQNWYTSTTTHVVWKCLSNGFMYVASIIEQLYMIENVVSQNTLIKHTPNLYVYKILHAAKFKNWSIF